MPRAASALRSRSSVSSGKGAKAAATAGRRCAAVTMGSASLPSGARDSVNLLNASWRERSLSPLMTGRVWEAMGKVLQGRELETDGSRGRGGDQEAKACAPADETGSNWPTG